MTVKSLFFLLDYQTPWKNSILKLRESLKETHARVLTSGQRCEFWQWVCQPEFNCWPAWQSHNKVVKLPADFIVLTPYTPAPHESPSELSSPASTSSLRTDIWPHSFPIPEFSYDAELALQKGNVEVQSRSELLSSFSSWRIEELVATFRDRASYILYQLHVIYFKLTVFC